jgi:hypothetical protein
MRVNEAGWDRALRVAAGLVLLYLGWADVVTGGVGSFLRYFGLLPLLTGVFGFCPAYTLFGLRTNKG